MSIDSAREDAIAVRGRRIAESGEYWPGRAPAGTPLPPETTEDGQIAAGKPVEGMPRLWRATDLKTAEQPRWLAKGRLPRGAISLLVGDEGIGKSLLWVWVAAAVTTGKALPQFGIPAREAATVILVCTEDDWTTTVRPRLDVAGADLNLVEVICTEDDGSGSPVFPRDLFLIVEAEQRPALIVVDAWLDTVPAALSVRDPQHARQALHPWREAATLTDAAVLLLCHTNRVVSANARDRYGATGELRKKARMTLFAQTSEDNRLVVGPEKMNTAAPIPASTFTIAAVPHFRPTDDSDGTVPLLVYAGDSDRTAREHLAANTDFGEEPGGNPAKLFLLDYLTREGGEAKAADVLKAGRVAGFSDQEMKDARRRHRRPRIESRKASGFSDGWVWALRDEGGTPPEGGTKYPEGGGGGSQYPMPPSTPPSPPSTNVPPSADSSTAPDSGPESRPAMPHIRHLTAVPPAPKQKRSDLFTGPTGQGRCPVCRWHVEKMGGHAETCTANECA
jgi:AAA domain